MREVEDDKELAGLNDFFRGFLDDVYSGDVSIADAQILSQITGSDLFPQTTRNTRAPSNRSNRTAHLHRQAKMAVMKRLKTHQQTQVTPMEEVASEES